ncbi:MAG: PHP domain-containing protein [Dehalococcoidia bacterium]|nr:PHP domain-containing protein [Dehalococcoidia bacterium]
MYRSDLHIHTRYSHDSAMLPEDIVRIALQRGLSAIAITDHNTIAGGLAVAEHTTLELEVIVGAEMMTDKGEVIGLFLSQEIRAKGLEDVIAEIRGQGGLVIVPHPFDALRHSAFPITDEYAPLVDGVEGFNARCILSRYNGRAREFAARHGLAIVAGSDAHYANEIGLAGIVTDTPDIRQAILNHSTILFGRRSPVVNHVRTKAGKLYRAARR